MLEELTAQRPAGKPVISDLLDRLAKRGLARLLDWQPAGALLVELPSGERFRFGKPVSSADAVLRLGSYAMVPKVLRGGALGFAESYMDGDVECSDLVAFFRFFLRNRSGFEASARRMLKGRLIDRLFHLARRNSRRGSRRNISEHYDLGNDFYRLWLDPSMLYSSALYGAGAATLEEAQAEKLKRILELLDLSGGAEILEIGCGWGAFALAAARDHSARVTGLTLSHEQLAFARAAADEHGLADRCAFRQEDYRDAGGQYDRIVSIEMIEAVGEAYWPTYFRVLAERLKAGGSAVIQAITIDEGRFAQYRRSADFIQRYVFPGGMLPTPTIIAEQAEAAGLVLDHSERFGPSYAETLREWRERFEAAWPEIAKLGFDEHFRRRWRYYLAYCEAGFLEGAINVGFYRLRKA